MDANPATRRPLTRLDSATLAALAAAESPHTVAWCVESGEQRIWIKRTAGRATWSSRIRSGLFIALGLILGRGLRRSRAFSMSDGGLEAARLRFYRAKGLPVPAVVAAVPGVIALEDVGTSLKTVLGALDEEPQRDRLVERAAGELIRFHASGEWHGGAQLRNLTLRDARMWRIDFEEPYGGWLATPLLQVYDLCLMLTSAERYVGPTTLARVAQRWLHARSEPEIETAFRRVLHLVSALCRFPLARLAGREYRRMRAARDAMTAAWEQLRSQGVIEARPIVPLSWKAVALSVSLILVSDDLAEFVMEHDEPEEVFEIDDHIEFYEYLDRAI